MIEVVLVLERGRRVPAKLKLPPLPFTYIWVEGKRYVVAYYEQHLDGSVPVIILGKEVYA